MNYLQAYIELSRPVNVIISLLSIGIGALVTGTISPVVHLVLAMISGGLICAGGNAVNDYYDIDIDRMNKPNRPLPSKRVTVGQVYIFSLVLFIVGIGMSAVVNLQVFAIAVTASVLLYVYSSHLKRTALWGNLVVSAVSGLAFVYGGTAVDRFHESLIPAAFAFLFHLGREIIKDMEDIRGDAENNAQTLPIRYGLNFSRIVATFVFVALIILTILPYFWGIYNLIYLWIVILGVDLILVYVIFSMWQYPDKKNLHRLSEFLKADMLVGLLALYVGIQT